MPFHVQDEVVNVPPPHYWPDHPGHHSKCRALHILTHPCFPTSNDVHTHRQRAWIEKNKENIPPTLKRENAEINHRQKETWDQPKADPIEEDDSEPDVEEEERHYGSEHSLPRRDQRDLRIANPGQRPSNHDHMVSNSKDAKRSVRKR